MQSVSDVGGPEEITSPLDRTLFSFLVGFDRSASFLEVGLGEGRLTRQAVSRFHHVVAVDSDPRHLMTIRPRLGGRAVSLLAMDAHRLGFPDQFFDIAAEFNALGHFADPGRVVAEMIRVVRPGGVVMFLASWRSEALILKAGWLPAQLTGAGLAPRLMARGRVVGLIAERP